MPKKKKQQESTAFAPTKMQLDYLEAFIISESNKKTEIAKLAGVDRTTIYKWRKDPGFVKWFNGEVSKLMKASLPDIYKEIQRRAKRNHNDSKLFLERFDEDYSEKRKLDVEENVNINFVPADDKS